MTVNVVIGASYGDEGKGLVSGWLAKTAANKVITVLFNGGAQRGHTVIDKSGQRHVVHTVGAGRWTSSDHVTFYHRNFMVDPIALALEGDEVIIDPECRVVIPSDVLSNREVETSRGSNRHGSCGMGIYSCFSRSQNKDTLIQVKDLFKFNIYSKLLEFQSIPDDIYNLDNFMRAIDFIKRSCRVISLEELLEENLYATYIFEGGQGLLLDMDNKADYPHLTPSKTGAAGISSTLKYFADNGAQINLYYVSRGYITRHGNGPMEGKVLAANEIMPGLKDYTNEANEWQGSIRYGTIDRIRFINRIIADRATVPADASTNIVFTHMNVTDRRVLFTDKYDELRELTPEYFRANHIYISDNETDLSCFK